MSDNDEIKPGDRFEAVDGWSLPMGTVFTASGPWGRYWAVSERVGLWDLGNPVLWRRLPRTDAPTGCCGTCRGRRCEPGYNRCEICKHLCPVTAAPPLAAPPRCAAGCTPKEPCRTEGVCPVFREEYVEECVKDSNPWRTYSGISADALPPARASTYQPRCAELSGWGSWNGRARK